MSLGAIIKSYRTANKITQKKLAIALDIDTTYLSKLENGKTGYPPSLKLLEKIIKITGCDRSIIYQSGRIDNLYPVFEYLAKEYRGFLPLLREMNRNPDFAKKVFSQQCDRNPQY